MSKVKGKADLVATFSVEFGDPPYLVTRGWKLFKRPSGLWPSEPGHRYNGVWENTTHVLNHELLNEISRAAQDLYAQLP